MLQHLPDDDPRLASEAVSLLCTARQLELPTIHGEARLTVPAGVQSGTVLRLRGKGLPDLHGRSVGDQLVRVRLWTPQDLSGEQEELFRSLRETESPIPEKLGSREHRGFWSRVKEALTS
jgi:molecular chaperone DnaJ